VVISDQFELLNKWRGKMSDDEIVINELLDDTAILKHFDGKPAFKEFRAEWPSEKTAQFCRIVRSVHCAGLDWWHVDIGVQLRFWRKLPESKRAKAVFGSIRGKDFGSITLKQEVGC
jgi:5-methylcytosine-specific restriction enzyme B